MLTIAAALGAVDFLATLLSLLGHGAYFATADNGWTRFTPFLPTWLTVTDTVALKPYYEGGSTLFTPTHLAAWGPPLAAWGGFVLVLLYVMTCVNTLVREPWMHAERLGFPIIQLPLALTDERGTLFQSRWFWGGLALVAAWDVLCGISFVDPRFPAFGMNGFDVGQWFPNPPWSAIGYQSGKALPVGIYPFVIGLGYLLPTDLLFSCWVFFLVTRVEQVGVNALGFQADTAARWPYLEAQSFGAYAAVCAAALWGARRHLRWVWEQLDVPGGYRRALVGILLGSVFLVAFAVRAGMPPVVAVAFFVVYGVIAFAITRMRVELGAPAHDLHFIGPSQTLYYLLGSEALGPQALTSLTVFYWFNRAYRSHPMPSLIETEVGVRMAGGSPRGLVAALLLAALVGGASYCAQILEASYHLGAAAKIRAWGSLGSGNEAYSRLASWLSLAVPPDRREVGGVVVGFTVAAGLSLLRQRVVGFPLHALGYALAGGFSMMWSWLSLFLAWAIKLTVLRYGGLRLWRSAVPFFFGVIVGDFLVGGLWSLVGIALDIPVYTHWNG